MRDGKTALFVASYQGHAAVVEALLEAGADPDAARNDGVTPLLGAVLAGQLEVVQLLCAYGASRLVPPALRPAVRRHRLEHIASAADQPKIAAFLKETRKHTALCYAHVLGASGLRRVETLLRAGADLGPARRAEALAKQHPEHESSALILRACSSWSPETHHLFPLEQRRSALDALWVAAEVASQSGVHRPVLVEKLLPFLVQRSD